MLEFGSDFHFCSDFFGTNSFSQKECMLYANGRQPIQHLINTYKWKRIWIPMYFCYEVIDSIEETGISICTYKDSPVSDDTNAISNIDFRQGDVLLRVNYFGLRRWRDNTNIPVPVIEDHSHDLIGEWAAKSNADWAIASLRKTLPLPEGGIMWSPINNFLPDTAPSGVDNDLLTYKRLTAMLLKKLYLTGENIDKCSFREFYSQTENAIGEIPVCQISEYCKSFFESFDIENWYKYKISNWRVLSKIEIKGATVLVPENLTHSTPFSLTLNFTDKFDRELFKQKLIEQSIYPAILWNVPDSVAKIAPNVNILSIHCDARYNQSDIGQMKDIISKISY